MYVPRNRGFAKQVSSEGTTRIASTFGTSVTPSTSGMGSDAAIGSALTEDVHEVEIRISATGADSASREIAVELRGDRAGGTSYVTLIPGMLSGGSFQYDLNPRIFTFPLFIPSGTTLAARAYGSVTTACRVLVLTRSRPQRPDVSRSGHVVEAVGLSGRVGTAITLGTTNKGSRTLLGTTTRDLWHWQLALQLGSGDAAWVNTGIHLDLEYSVDGGTNFVPIITDSIWTTTSGEQLFGWQSFGELWVPAGAGIYARGQSRNDTADIYAVAAYGVG